MLFLTLLICLKFEACDKMKKVFAVGDLVRHFIYGDFSIVTESSGDTLCLYDLKTGSSFKAHYSIFDLV